MSTKTKCNECKNAVCFIKQYCLPIWIKKIEPSKVQMKYYAGESVFREGDRICGIYFIKHGQTSVISTDINQKAQTDRVLTDGHILGHLGFRGLYLVNAVALSDTTMCFIDNDSFYNMYINNPQFSLEMVKFYSR